MNWDQLLNEERPRKSSSSEDHRSQFERDHDRCIFSTPVKRLQDKAQVFPLEPHDAVRTRLTHSLEVSSVARGLALGVAKDLIEDGRLTGSDAEREQKKRNIEAIAATCGLLHDIGNPPFGHAGEYAIQEWFKKKISKESLVKEFNGRTQLVQDFIAFEGNAQTLRLVTKLQILADFNGLNLTFGTLSALLKYTAQSDQTEDDGDHAKAKPCYFASENEIVRRIREFTGTGESRNPLTYVVEAADDITYSVADIEDGVKKGILLWRDLETAISNTALGQRVLQATDVILAAGNSRVPDGLPDDVYASAFRTAAIGILVPDARETFRQSHDAILEGTFKSELVQEGKTSGFINLLKRIGREKVYNTSSTLKLELMGRQVIGDLLTLFWEGAEVLPLDGKLKTKKFEGKLGALLSANYRKVFGQYASAGELPESYYRFQLLTDYICGMTDTFAKSLHSELRNG